MSGRQTPDLERRILQESERLDREFGALASPDLMKRCVVEARLHIAGANVPDFAPIFFARHARRLLREAIAADTRATGAA